MATKTFDAEVHITTWSYALFFLRSLGSNSGPMYVREQTLRRSGVRGSPRPSGAPRRRYSDKWPGYGSTLAICEPHTAGLPDRHCEALPLKRGFWVSSASYPIDTGGKAARALSLEPRTGASRDLERSWRQTRCNTADVTYRRPWPPAPPWS